MTHASLQFDGGARPTNPGHAGIGVVVTIAGNMHSIGRYIGKKTNNHAEYNALLVGISYAHHLGATEIDIYGDSKLVVEQVNERWQVKDVELRPMRRDARDKLDKLFPGSWTLSYMPRKDNYIADALATAAAIWGRQQNPWVPEKLKAKWGVGKQVDPFSRAHAPARVRHNY